jgi:hypothetical protein
LSAEPDDYHMLSLIVTDALGGADIARRYPTFYTRLSADPQLSQAFVEVMELLQETPTEPDSAIPLSQNLQFLHKIGPMPLIESAASGRLRVSWQLFQQQLTQFFFQGPAVAYRSGLPLLEDESFILIEDQVTVSELTLQVLLEAIRPVDQPGWLQLQLLTAAEADPLPPLAATVRWGDYTATASPDRYGSVTFPPLAVATIVDQAAQAMTSDLELILELQRA